MGSVWNTHQPVRHPPRLGIHVPHQLERPLRGDGGARAVKGAEAGKRRFGMLSQHGRGGEGHKEMPERRGHFE